MRVGKDLGGGQKLGGGVKAGIKIAKKPDVKPFLRVPSGDMTKKG